jgi:hypothetical protein
MYTHSGEFRVEYYRIQAAWLYALPSKGDGHHSPSRGSFYPTHLPTLELFSGYGTPFFPRRAASAHMTKSLALDPHDPSSRGDLLPSRVGIPPRVASIIWNRNFASLCLIHAYTHTLHTAGAVLAACSMQPAHQGRLR